MKFGFCCKYITSPDQMDGVKKTDASYLYNVGTTTVAHMGRLNSVQAEDKLWSLIQENVFSIRRLVTLVSKDIPEKRMLRLSSDILPLYTHPDWSWYYKLQHVQDFLQKEFSIIGEIARSSNTRLSFHPGQFTVLSSHREEVVQKSIEEFEYHCDMVRWMNFGQSFQDMKVNVHLSGKGGADVFRKVYPKLSYEARNTITLENDEFTSSLSDCLEVSDLVPIVFDIHHEWIHNGTFLELSDDRISRVIDSWRGERPAMHYSQSKESLLLEADDKQLPVLLLLLESGYKKQKLRAHSDFYWNKELNQLVKEYSQFFDIQCECKSKNLGRDRLFAELFS